MLNKIQPLRERRFLSMATRTTTVTATAAATPPTVPPTTEDIELGAASDGAEVELVFSLNGYTFLLKALCFCELFFLRDNYQCTVKQNRTINVVTICSLKVCLQMASRFITVIYQTI